MTAMASWVPPLPPISVGQAKRRCPAVVGALARLGQQRLPLLARQAVVVPVGARVFAAVVEEADVVVLRLLQRLDLAPR